MENNILILISSLKIGGGAQRIAAELGSNLKKKGYDVTYLTFYDFKPEYEYEGRKICLNEDLKMNFIFQFIKTLNRSKKISKICKRNNIDKVISFQYSQNIPAILSKVIFNNDSKIIMAVRNNPVIIDSLIIKEIVKRTYPKADKVVVQTKRIKEILSKDYSIDNSIAIPNMSDLEKFQDLSKERIPKVHEELFDKDFIFITIGSLTEQKAQWYLLRSFKSVFRYNSNIKLIILGDGPLKGELINLAKKLNIDERVFFLGELKNVFPYLRKSDCFVFTSLYEGFPNVLTEALSQNLPVISTDCVSGPREILCPELEFDKDIEYPYYGEYGILTKPFEDKIFFKTFEEKKLSEEEYMFAKSMIELIGNQSLRKKYSNNLKRVKDFEKEKIMQKWMEKI